MAAGSIVRAPINEPLFEVLDTLDAFVANLNYVNEFFDALAVHEAFAARNVAQLTNPFNLSNVRYCGRWDTAVSYIHDFFTLLENIGAVHNQMKERLNTLRCCSNSLKNYILKYRCLQVDCDEQFQQQLNVTIRTLRKTRADLVDAIGEAEKAILMREQLKSFYAACPMTSDSNRLSSNVSNAVKNAALSYERYHHTLAEFKAAKVLYNATIERIKLGIASNVYDLGRFVKEVVAPHTLGWMHAYFLTVYQFLSAYTKNCSSNGLVDSNPPNSPKVNDIKQEFQSSAGQDAHGLMKCVLLTATARQVQLTKVKCSARNGSNTLLQEVLSFSRSTDAYTVSVHEAAQKVFLRLSHPTGKTLEDIINCEVTSLSIVSSTVNFNESNFDQDVNRKYSGDVLQVLKQEEARGEKLCHAFEWYYAKCQKKFNALCDIAKEHIKELEDCSVERLAEELKSTCAYYGLGKAQRVRPLWIVEPSEDATLPDASYQSVLSDSPVCAAFFQKRHPEFWVQQRLLCFSAPRNALLDNPTVSCGSSVENLAVAGTLDFTVVLEGAPDAEELSVAPSIFLNIEDERVKFVVIACSTYQDVDSQFRCSPNDQIKVLIPVGFMWKGVDPEGNKGEFPSRVVKSLDVETYSSCDADALMTRSASRVVAANALSTDDETHTEAGNEAKRLSRAEVKVSITQHTMGVESKHNVLHYVRRPSPSVARSPYLPQSQSAQSSFAEDHHFEDCANSATPPGASQSVSYTSLSSVFPEALCSTAKPLLPDVRPDSRAARKLNEHTAEFRERFHVLNENVLRYYSCALSLRILLQGRMYITEHFIGFFSAFNDVTIFGLEPTTVLIPFSQIVALRKRNTALIFPNSIEIELANKAVYFFASFLVRDKTYDILMHQWAVNVKAQSIPNSQSTLNNATIDSAVDSSTRLSCRRNSSPTFMQSEAEGTSFSTPSCRDDAGAQHRSASPRRFSHSVPLEPVPFPAVPTRSDIEQLPSNWVNITGITYSPCFPDEPLKFVYPCARWRINVRDVMEHLVVKNTFLHRLFTETGVKDISFGSWFPDMHRCFSMMTPGQNVSPKQQSSCVLNAGALNEEHSESPRRPQRRITYQRPVKAPGGFGAFIKLPPYASVEETWVLFVYSQSCIMAEVTIYVSDIPYANAFHVLLRYRFTEIRPGETQFDTELTIVWDRSTLMRRKIESDTLSNARQGISDFTRIATDFLYQLKHSELSNVNRTVICEASCAIATYSTEKRHCATSLSHPENFPRQSNASLWNSLRCVVLSLYNCTLTTSAYPFMSLLPVRALVFLLMLVFLFYFYAQVTRLKLRVLHLEIHLDNLGKTGLCEATKEWNSPL